MRQWLELDVELKTKEYSGSMEEWNTKFIVDQLKREYGNTAIDLVRVAALCKHGSFHEEQEWRLTLPVESKRTLQSTNRNIRLRGTIEVPYLDVRLNQDGSDRLPLTEVVIGSGTTGEDLLASIKSILWGAGYEVPVRYSDIP